MSSSISAWLLGWPRGRGLRQSRGPRVRPHRRPSRRWREPRRESACRCRPERASAWRVRATCGDVAGVKRGPPSAQLAAQADHLDGRGGGLKALVAGLDAGAVERLLQRFAGEHAKAVGNAGLLLRLADAARDFVVDGLVVRGFAAQQAAESDDGVDAALVGARRAPRRESPMRRERGRSRYRQRSAPLRSSASSAPSSRRSVMTAFQRETTMANFIPAAERSPSRATGLPLTGSVQAQKLKRKPGSGSTVKRRDFQSVSVMGERRATPRRRLARGATLRPPGGRSRAT